MKESDEMQRSKKCIKELEVFNYVLTQQSNNNNKKILLILLVWSRSFFLLCHRYKCISGMVVDWPHCLLIVAQGFQFSSTLFMHFRRASVSQNKSLYSLEFKISNSFFFSSWGKKHSWFFLLDFNAVTISYLKKKRELFMLWNLLRGIYYFILLICVFWGLFSVF